MIILTKKINGTFKSKLKSRTPINIAIPKALADQIKKIPHLSLKALASNQGSSKDWYNITFRIRIGLDIAKEIYTEDASIAMQELYELTVKIMDRFIVEDLWYVTEQEYNDLLSGLEATDQMQDETTRRLQLEVFKRSDVHVKQLIAENQSRYETKQVA